MNPTRRCNCHSSAQQLGIKGLKRCGLAVRRLIDQVHDGVANGLGRALREQELTMTEAARDPKGKPHRIQEVAATLADAF